MGYKLRPELHFCQAGAGFIFLDLAKDRYFRLPARLEAHFRVLVDDPLAGGSASPPLIDAGILQKSTFRQTLAHPRLVAANATLEGCVSISPGVIEIARAASKEMWIGQQLRIGRLSSLISSYSRSKFARDLPQTIDDETPRRIVRAYERAKLLRSPANRCLSRSLALARRLANVGCDALLVIGVRPEPFIAHSWVQYGDTVLNDTPDEVSRYTPIFSA